MAIFSGVTFKPTPISRKAKRQENVTACHFYNLIHTLSRIYLRLAGCQSQKAIEGLAEVKQIIVHILPTISFNNPLSPGMGTGEGTVF